MIPTLIVLLCLGLRLGPRTTLVAGSLPIPTIWAEPGTVVTKGKPVTIWCLGTQEAQKYYLCKKESLKPQEMYIPLEPGNKTNFSIPFMTEYYAGLYRCCYQSPSGWSEYSDSLELVVTGFYGKPSISALPSTLVTPGRNVTIQCSSQQGYGKYILTSDGEQSGSWVQDSQRQSNGHFRALFPVGPVTSNPRWEFRCYGYYQRTSHVWSVPSDALQLQLLAMI
ncbi:leukocyte immunoglobulin-like receptor subfamily A member 5 isoform X2 [Nannospalax galili]|uniref:leukocyte immunoglobulin-like receptor subfamily A member 5 isoform X2 n=1 Tax=Nannospalax galili TaxID=1026970 RepID=UPI00111BE0D8|nr:leukocyte immunoglobulin-like receptor subfamily A member 5 isoform X2 [Nannospalax galili]